MAVEATGVIAGELERRATAGRRLRRAAILIRDNPLGFFGLLMVVLLGVFALFAPVIAPHDPKAFVADKNLDPSLSNLFGTDDLGRDMFSRVVFGARISLLVGFGSVLFGTVVGTALGIFSGYVGGAIDNLIQRAVDTAIAFPILLGLLILRQVLGPHLQTLILAVGIAIIFPIVRIVRGAVLSERNNQYVEAARALGASTPRILFIHIAPNVAALAIIVATTALGGAILAEATLSFLGLGLPGSVTWGGDVNAARNSYPIHVWWAFFPGLAITLTVLGANLLGDSLRDIFDPRLRGRL
jgi:peptide/nickel transport system permease protein